MDASSSHTRPGPTTAATVATCGLVLDGAGAAACAMYEVAELGPSGARLAGAILLEVEERVVLELGFPDGTVVRARARVVAVDRDGSPGVRVDFTELDDSARQVIAARAAAGSKER